MFNWHYCPIYYYLPRAWEIWRWRQVNFWHNSRGQCWWCRTNTGTNRNQHRNWFRCWFWCWCVRSKVVCHFFIHRKRGTGQRCENAVAKSFKVAAAAPYVRVVPRRDVGKSRLVSRVPIIFVSFVCAYVRRAHESVRFIFRNLKPFRIAFTPNPPPIISSKSLAVP